VAVANITGPNSVTSDMDAHTITVEFDDGESSIEEIVEALGNAGYTVPDRTKIPQ